MPAEFIQTGEGYINTQDGYPITAETTEPCCCGEPESRFVHVLSCCFPTGDFWVRTNAVCSTTGLPVWTDGGPPVFFAVFDPVTQKTLCFYTDPLDVRTFQQLPPNATILRSSTITICADVTSCDQAPCDPCPTCCDYVDVDLTECGGDRCYECGSEYIFEFNGAAQANEQRRFIGFVSASQPYPCGTPDCVLPNSSQGIFYHISGIENTYTLAHEFRVRVRVYCDPFGVLHQECLSYYQRLFEETRSITDRWNPSQSTCPPPQGTPPITNNIDVRNNFVIDECPADYVFPVPCAMTISRGFGIMGFGPDFASLPTDPNRTPCQGSASETFYDPQEPQPCGLRSYSSRAWNFNASRGQQGGSATFTQNESAGYDFAPSRIFNGSTSFSWSVSTIRECAIGQGCDGPQPIRARHQTQRALAMGSMAPEVTMPSLTPSALLAQLTGGVL